ncbi:Lrp/AsnC family transcriptional regulator [Candidatus Bathyarchaeota archaeon]|nr:MAG: Lrp/AsnC family transcriptional regulator [Candidatus Bathyarchaeota archaeon]
MGIIISEHPLRFSQKVISFQHLDIIMDNIDLEILKILKSHARAKYVNIAKKIGLTEGAVRRRIKKLQKDGIIRRFTIETTAEFEGVVLVETEPTMTNNVAKRMKKIATRIFEVSGDYDIAAFIQAYTIDDLNKKIDAIRKLPGVLNTNTLIKLKD